MCMCDARVISDVFALCSCPCYCVCAIDKFVSHQLIN